MFQGIRTLFLFLLFAIVFFPSKAQMYNGNSPYSQFGLGDIQPQGTVRNMGMAGTGVALSTYEYINNLNPALLCANKYMNFDSAATNYTMLDAAGQFTLSKISTTSNMAVDGSVYEAYLNLALPVSSKWVTNIGLQPYNLIAYQSHTKTNVLNAPAPDTSTVMLSYKGTGGLYKVFVSNGIDLTKNLSAGLEVAYLFGNENHNSSSQTQVDFKYIETENNSAIYNGMSLKPGLVYRGKFNPSAYQDRATYFNFGLTAEIIPVLRAINNLNSQRFDSLSNSLNSTEVSHTVSFLSVPTTYRAGFSIDKPGDWNVSIDVNYANWSKYRGVGDSAGLYKSYGVAIGAEYYLKSELEHRKKVLRTGFSYSKTPIGFVNPGSFNITAINNYSFTMGCTVPLGKLEASDRKRPLSKVNAAIILGEQGTTQMNLVKEIYLKVYLGFIINDKWFGRSKVE